MESHYRSPDFLLRVKWTGSRAFWTEGYGDLIFILEGIAFLFENTVDQQKGDSLMRLIIPERDLKSSEQRGGC